MDAPPNPTDTDEHERLPRLAVTYDITSSSPMDLLGLLRDVCSIVWVVDAGDESLGAMGRMLKRSGTVLDTAGEDAAAVADRLGHEGIDGVVAFTDSQLELAATVAAVLGLPGNPLDVVARLNDKYLQREAMESAGLAVPRFRLIPAGTPAGHAPDIVAALTYPLVLKPLQGDSSRDVVAVQDVDRLVSAIAGGLAAHDDLIAEEYLADRPGDGDRGIGGYVSAEMIVQDGVAVPVALTGKFALAPPFRECGNFMPHALDVDDAAAVLDLAIGASDALGVRSGALHTEIKLTPEGPRVIEVNGRIGGGAIDPLHTRRFGVSLTELATRVALGHPLSVSAETPARFDGPFLYEFFAQPPVTAVELRGISGLDRIVGVAGAESAAANRSAGDAIDWRDGSQGFVLRVTGTAADRATLGSVPAKVTDTADISYRHAADGV